MKNRDLLQLGLCNIAQLDIGAAYPVKRLNRIGGRKKRKKNNAHFLNHRLILKKNQSNDKSWETMGRKGRKTI